MKALNQPFTKTIVLSYAYDTTSLPFKPSWKRSKKLVRSKNSFGKTTFAFFPRDE